VSSKQPGKSIGKRASQKSSSWKVDTAWLLTIDLEQRLFDSDGRLRWLVCSTYAGRWVFGDVACRLMNTFWGVNLYASIFTMTLMSVDRYLAVVHPLTSISYRTCRNALVVCAVIWLFGFLFVLPLCLYSTVSRNQCLVRVTFSQFVTLRSACLFIGTARILCGSGSMKRHGVCPFVCPSMGPQQQTRCCRFAVVGSAGRRYRSIVAASCCQRT